MARAFSRRKPGQNDLPERLAAKVRKPLGLLHSIDGKRRGDYNAGDPTEDPLQRENGMGEPSPFTLRVS